MDSCVYASSSVEEPLEIDNHRAILTENSGFDLWNEDFFRVKLGLSSRLKLEISSP